MQQCSACLTYLPNNEFPRRIDSYGNIVGHGKTCLLCINDLRRALKCDWNVIDPQKGDSDPTLKHYKHYNWVQMFGKTRKQKAYNKRKAKAQRLYRERLKRKKQGGENGIPEPVVTTGTVDGNE